MTQVPTESICGGHFFSVTSLFTSGHQNGVLFSSVVKVFHDIAYKAKDRGDLLAGIDEFLDEVIVLPPGEWDPAIRIEPPKSIPSADKRSQICSYPPFTRPNVLGKSHHGELLLQVKPK